MPECASFSALPYDQHTFRKALLFFTRLLEEAAVDSPKLSAELLLARAMGMTRPEFIKECILAPARPVPPLAVERAFMLARRRAKGEPMAYLLGHKEFYGHDFLVTPAVLIPRPETELMIDTALALVDSLPPARRPLLADFGTGSGCIAVSMALERPGLSCLALDRSVAALDIARENARRLGAFGITFLRADFCAPPLADASLALLLSNPPYVDEAEYQTLSVEVRRYEPRQALVPDDADGLSALRAIAVLAQRLLAPGGWALMELGASQGETVLGYFKKASFAQKHLFRDLAGLPRLVAAQKR